ncbi:DUF1254 domain-containing protein (plasmid) [Rhizobium leguminosarum]
MIRALVAAVFLLIATQSSAQDVTPQEARAIAREAYVYGFPLVDSYRILHSYFVDKGDPEYKAAWNERVYNNARVFTPEDKAMGTPNSDSPYSQAGLDLRAEPIVLSVPEIESGRYYSVEINDLYTFITDYVGSRTTGNEAGNFLIAGPDWHGEKPPGIKKVIRSETQLSFLFFRTQLKGPDDIDTVKKVQEGYKIEPLSAFLGKPAPRAPPSIDFMKPLSAAEQRTFLDFFKELNFVLQFCPTHPSEIDLMKRFAKVGVGAGQTFDADALSPETRKALEDGRDDAWQAHQQLLKRVEAGEVTSGDVLGSRESLKNNYLYRMHGAVAGIWGNMKEEAIYPGWYVDSSGDRLDGRSRYQLRFAPGQLPPVNAFWSLTMYGLPSHLLVDNPIDRYLINSPMLPNLNRDPDGGVTLYVQHERPGAKYETNWLPAPEGPFVAVLRMYWPKTEALDGTWKVPPFKKVD